MYSWVFCWIPKIFSKQKILSQCITCVWWIIKSNNTTKQTSQLHFASWAQLVHYSSSMSSSGGPAGCAGGTLAADLTGVVQAQLRRRRPGTQAAHQQHCDSLPLLNLDFCTLFISHGATWIYVDHLIHLLYPCQTISNYDKWYNLYLILCYEYIF